MPKLEQLPVSGVPCYKLLEFNGVVLAYRLLTQPVPELQYITWRRDRDGTGLELGHYFTSNNDALNEQQAMRDYCVRSGLIRECDLLANKELDELSATVSRLQATVESRRDATVLERLADQIDRIKNDTKEMYLDKAALLEERGIEAAPSPEVAEQELEGVER